MCVYHTCTNISVQHNIRKGLIYLNSISLMPQDYSNMTYQWITVSSPRTVQEMFQEQSTNRSLQVFFHFQFFPPIPFYGIPQNSRRNRQDGSAKITTVNPSKLSKFFFLKLIMTVCKANEVRRTELMKNGYLPQANEACFIPIALQIEKLNYLVGKKACQDVLLRAAETVGKSLGFMFPCCLNPQHGLGIFNALECSFLYFAFLFPLLYLFTFELLQAPCCSLQNCAHRFKIQ